MMPTVQVGFWGDAEMHMACLRSHEEEEEPGLNPAASSRLGPCHTQASQGLWGRLCLCHCDRRGMGWTERSAAHRCPGGALSKGEARASRSQNVTSLLGKRAPKLGIWVTRLPFLENPPTQLTGWERRKGFVGLCPDTPRPWPWERSQ